MLQAMGISAVCILLVKSSPPKASSHAKLMITIQNFVPVLVLPLFPSGLKNIIEKRGIEIEQGPMGSSPSREAPPCHLFRLWRKSFQSPRVSELQEQIQAVTNQEMKEGRDKEEQLNRKVMRTVQ